MRLAQFFAEEEGTIFLYSGGSLDSAQQSFLFLFPYEFCVARKDRFWHSFGKPETVEPVQGHPWELLKQVVVQDGGSDPDWAGFLGYEMGAWSDRDRIFPSHDTTTPDLYLQRSAVTVIWDHEQQSGRVVIKPEGAERLSSAHKIWFDRLQSLQEWKKLIQSLEEEEHSFSESDSVSRVDLEETPQSYAAKIAQAQELIRAGDIYQVNLSRQILLQGKRDPFALFKQLALTNPAPFSAYLRLKDGTVVSSSPERLLQKKGSTLETRPIKGTMPRGKTPDEDENNRRRLLSSPKDRAELLMITDLMRHDLGRVSIVGSVKVKELRRCETYANVFHLLSVIESQALPDVHPVDILRSCFPGGSITGCPKLRAMEVIADLEKRPRGVYTGSIGYFTGHGDFDFNIAIRTLLMYKELINIQLGGAIVIDSKASTEFEETEHKGISIFRAIGYEP